MAETWGWRPEETLAQPFAVIVDMLEARASRLQKTEVAQPRHVNGEEVLVTNDLASLGIGRG